MGCDKAWGCSRLPAALGAVSPAGFPRGEGRQKLASPLTCCLQEQLQMEAGVLGPPAGAKRGENTSSLGSEARWFSPSWCLGTPRLASSPLSLSQSLLATLSRAACPEGDDHLPQGQPVSSPQLLPPSAHCSWATTRARGSAKRCPGWPGSSQGEAAHPAAKGSRPRCCSSTRVVEETAW